MKRTVIVMVKEPRPGRVKTRLGRDIGAIPATWWFRHQTRSLLNRIRDPRWRLMLAVSPDAAGLKSRFWPGDLARVPQGNGDLGDRMRRALSQAEKGPVCLVGADIPEIERQHLARAFDALGSADAVFGPAPDGGYWLVGAKRTRALPVRLFKGVRWSSEHALRDSIASWPDARVALVDTLRDVDRADDLRMTAPGVRAT